MLRCVFLLGFVAVRVIPVGGESTAFVFFLDSSLCRWIIRSHCPCSPFPGTSRTHTAYLVHVAHWCGSLGVPRGCPTDPVRAKVGIEALYTVIFGAFHASPEVPRFCHRQELP